MWRSIGKGVLNKTIDVKVQALLCLNFDVNRFVKYSFSYGTSHMWRSIGKGVLFKTFDVKVQVHFVPKNIRVYISKFTFFNEFCDD